MFSTQQYELIDFGDGRKLERFGRYLLDRPSPSAEGIRRKNPSVWSQSSARFDRTTATDGDWTCASEMPKSWRIEHPVGCFELKLTEFGHVGLFPEQAANWQWIVDQVHRHKRPLKVLNLFAYTGGSTIAAASAGAEVVHVDSARNIVAWSRRNARLSSLADAPIRWICEDALKFARREVKRGSTYDAVILDPPSYGHGPKGEVWKLSDDLHELLIACGQLTEQRRAFLLLTCHTPGFGPAELEATLADAVFGHCQAGVKASHVTVTSADGRKLPSGVMARWPA